MCLLPPVHDSGVSVVKEIKQLLMQCSSALISGPTVWNALPGYLKNPTLSIDVFKRYFKTFLFDQYEQ